MTTFNVHVDPSDALSYLQRVSDQAPFAISKAVNAVANHGQQAIRENIKSKFTLRRETFVLNTVKIERADRATKTKLDATIRIDPTRDFLAKHEAGGIKTARDGRSIAIPTEHVRRNKSDIVPKAQRPRVLLDSKSALKGRIFKTDTGILRTLGRGKARVTNLLYALVRSVRITPRLGFVVTATKEIQSTWKGEMTSAFIEAERTARR